MTKIGKIIYIYDALCGWCYGFSNVINDIKAYYQDQFDFEIVSGGMILEDRVGSINQKFSFIKDSYKKVEDHTGCKFGPAYLKELEKGEMILSSMEPSKALAVIKTKSPENAFEYGSKLQNAIYFDGKDIKDENILAGLASDYISQEEFISSYNSEEVIKATFNDFKLSAALGINGYPSVLLEKDEKFYILARGFQYKMDLNNMFKQIIKSNSTQVVND